MRTVRGMLASLAVVAVGMLASGAVALGTQERTPPEAAGAGDPPPAPAWVRADGTVDPARLPSCVEVVGRDGLPVTKGNGEPVCIPSTELFGPPPGSPPENPAATDARNRALERRVARLPAPSASTAEAVSGRRGHETPGPRHSNM